jgi:hypothetical protein
VSEARELLSGLTAQLQALNLTLQHSQALQVKEIESRQTLSLHVAGLSQQIEGLSSQIYHNAARVDGRVQNLEAQLAHLASVLQSEEGYVSPAGYAPPPLSPNPERGRPFQVPTTGQFLGGLVGYSVDQYQRRGGGRGRSNR